MQFSLHVVLSNQMPSPVTDGISPHSYCFLHLLYSLYLQKFLGVPAIHNLGSGIHKLAAHANKCVFLDYSWSQKGYQCYNLVLRWYFASVDITFLESTPCFFNVNPPGDYFWVTVLHSTSCFKYLTLLIWTYFLFSFRVIAPRFSRSIKSILLLPAATNSCASTIFVTVFRSGSTLWARLVAYCSPKRYSFLYHQASH